MKVETATEKYSRNILPSEIALRKNRINLLERERLHTVNFSWHTTIAYQQHSRESTFNSGQQQRGGNSSHVLTVWSTNCRSSSAVFKYISDSLDDSRMRPASKVDLRRTVIRLMARLVGADACAAAGLVLSRFPDKHSAVIASLGAMPEKQYEYLKVRLPHHVAH